MVESGGRVGIGKETFVIHHCSSCEYWQYCSSHLVCVCVCCTRSGEVQ